MNELITETKRVLIVWKIFIIRTILYSIVMLGATWMTAANGLDIGALPFWDKVMLVVGIFVSWGMLMIAMFDKTASYIAAGKLPIEDKI